MEHWLSPGKIIPLLFYISNNSSKCIYTTVWIQYVAALVLMQFVNISILPFCDYIQICLKIVKGREQMKKKVLENVIAHNAVNLNGLHSFMEKPNV